MALINIPGIYDIQADEYHRDPCAEAPSLSASIAAEMVGRSPLHAWTKHPRLNPAFAPDEKPAFDLGTAAHHMVLRQSFWREQIAVVDADDWRTKAAQAQRDNARAAGLVPILGHQYERLEQMVSALEKHPQAGRAFIYGKPEQTLILEENELWFRARPDWLPDDRAAPIPDYKTTTDARPENWDRRFCLDHGGLIRMAFYAKLLRAHGYLVPALYYIVQEVTPPYAVTVRVVDPESDVMRLGRALLQKAITRWAECLRKNEWPGYEPTIGTVAIPEWAGKRLAEQNADWLAAITEAGLNPIAGG